MIKEFKDNSIRDTGIINRGMFEQVKMLYQQNPEAGGELAVSLMEYVLTGDHSSDNFMVAFAIANHKEVVAKTQARYEAAKEAKHEAIEAGLREIADLYNAGMKQVEIARKLGMQPPNVSKKLAKIRKEFPHLLKDGNVSNDGNLEISKFPEDGKFGNISNVSEVSNISSVAGISGNQESLETFEESLSEVGNVSKISSFQSFQHINVNVNDNVNDNVAGKSSISAGQGCAPTPPEAAPKMKFNF